MNKARRNPAVVAGLLGAWGAVVPQTAYAATLADLGRDVAGNPVATFALGVACGVAATSVVALLAQAHARREDAEKDDQAEEPTAVLGARGAVAASEEAGLEAPVAPAAQAESCQPAQPATPAPSRSHAAPKMAEPAGHYVGVMPVSGAYSVDETIARPVNAVIASRVPAVDEESANENDYVNVAERYVKHETLSARMAARARGVASVLHDRLGGDKFEGLPIIERADGSVGDVGTSWWNERLGESVRLVGAPDQLDLAPSVNQTADSLEIPAWMDPVPRRAAEARAEAAQVEGTEGRKLTPAMEFARSRAARIAQSVPEVYQGKYPERRDADELDQGDLWETALEAMDENIDRGPRVPAFSDVVGSADTIDDPTGLEDPTKFIPFRTPAGHPEVVDTESYIDYLIDDEFSRNKSQAARRSSREYLHVIQGGSQSLKSTAKLHRTRQRGAQAAYKPRHMASMVREA